MRPFVEPFDRLREALRWFVAVPELRLLHITTSEDLRLAVLTEVQAAQARPECVSPCLILEAPVDTDDLGWATRADELEDDFGVLTEEAAAQQPPLRISPLPPRRGEPTDAISFAARARAAVDSLPPPLDGLIVVLAPLLMAQPARWLTDVRLLIGSAELQRVRWVLVEMEPSVTSVLTHELGARAEAVDVRVDGAQSRATLTAMIAGMKSAPPGADAHRSAGMAGPRQPPPPRVRTASDAAVAQQALTAAGVPAAFGDQAVMQQLRVATLEAALAFQSGRPADAVRSQVQARDICVQAGLTKESLVMELVLASYLLQAGSPDQCVQVLDRVIPNAEAAGVPELVAQAHMARGGALLSQRRGLDAAEAYGKAGRAAEPLESPLLAIEAYRMMGQLLLQANQEQQAAAAFQHALQLASKASPHERARSSAPIAARDLAAVYRKFNMFAQASTLEAQATQWESEASPADGNGADGSATSGSTSAGPR
jgi:tetratricopeptide (TPR) repeat protein